MTQRILVAIDDSENAMRAVEFAAKTFSKEQKITLFSVIPDTAAMICNIDEPTLSPYFRSKQAGFCELEDKKREFMEQALEKGREVLLKEGFKDENITIKAHPKKKGIARDIAEEAGSGYDILVLGRRGFSAIQEFIFGSISQKVLHMVKDMSILVVN